MSDDSQKISVFLVDDHLVVREGVRVVLEQSGDIEVVGNPGERSVSRTGTGSVTFSE